jgi:hypothetical protein
MEDTDFPFLLPHEVLHHLLKANGRQRMSEFCINPDVDDPLSAIVKEVAHKLNLPAANIIPIGLHGDGAPFATKMKDSLEQFSWNLCAQPTSSRFVFTAIAKSNAGTGTMDSILDIFAWSMQCFVTGVFPSKRHDGQPFSKQENWRAKMAGKPLGVCGVLVQIRGDWAFYKSTFNLPSWSSELMCWLCGATKSKGSIFDYRQCGQDAAWRSKRYRAGEFVTLLRNAGQLSSIFKCPGLSLKHFMIDWLHAVDLGVSQLALGNTFNEIIELFPGRARSDRVTSFFQEMKAWYKEARPPSQLQTLTPEMVKLPGQPPKLRSKAGECRYLVPFGALIAERFNDGNPHRHKVSQLMSHLLVVQTCISNEPYNDQLASSACVKFCQLYASLEEEALAQGDELSWRCKPKLHMFQELIEFLGPEAGSPRHFWTYQDESWGGWLSKTATRRGGPKLAAATALNMLRRYRACVTSSM